MSDFSLSSAFGVSANNSLSDNIRDCMMADRLSRPDPPSRHYAATAASATSDEKMPGVSTGVYYGQFQRTEELNDRLRNRICVDTPLRPNHAPRAVNTRQVLMPTADMRPTATVGFGSYRNYSCETNHATITTRGPPREFLANIDTETILRNHVHALQRGADQSVYVPSSQSELYRDSAPTTTGGAPQPFPEIFVRPTFSENRRVKNVEGMATGAFYNNTRASFQAPR